MKDDSENTLEQLYSIAEIALMWRTTVSYVAKVFKREPGVLPVQRIKALTGMPDRLHQRRIPSSVLKKVESGFRQAAAAAASPPPAPPAPDRLRWQDPPKGLYSFNQIAAMMQIAPKTALRLFGDDPEVLGIAQPRFGRRKGGYLEYSTPRVPASVLQRVRQKLTKV